MVPATNGEDEILVCTSCDYAASLAVAKCVEQKVKESPKSKPKAIKEVSTPNVTTVEKVSQLLKVKPSQLVKTIIYIADDKPIAILVGGDFEVNETKVKNALKATTLELADEKAITRLTKGPMGYSGPVGLKSTRIMADHSLKGMKDFVTGANKKDAHLLNVNLDRDFKVDEWLDLRVVTKDDPCPKCGKKIKIEHAIEVGHTFKLGTKYSKSLNAVYLDKDGKEKEIIMGCYGIGVNRIIAASVEQNNDTDGIIWPLSISPYEIVVVPINILDEKLRSASEKVYKRLKSAGFDVLFDDRDERAGIKFKDIDLIGIPLRIVVSDKNLKQGKLEAKLRSSKQTLSISEEGVIEGVKKILDNLGHL